MVSKEFLFVMNQDLILHVNVIQSHLYPYLLQWLGLIPLHRYQLNLLQMFEKDAKLTSCLIVIELYLHPKIIADLGDRNYF